VKRNFIERSSKSAGVRSHNPSGEIEPKPCGYGIAPRTRVLPGTFLDKKRKMELRSYDSRPKAFEEEFVRKERVSCQAWKNRGHVSRPLPSAWLSS